MATGAITHESLITRELSKQSIPAYRLNKAQREKDYHLDSDRRLTAFLYTPDTFALIIAPMVLQQ